MQCGFSFVACALLRFVVFQLTFQFFKKCIERVPLAPMQPEWYDNIRRLIPDHLLQGTSLVKDLFDEVCKEFDISMQTITGEFYR